MKKLKYLQWQTLDRKTNYASDDKILAVYEPGKVEIFDLEQDELVLSESVSSSDEASAVVADWLGESEDLDVDSLLSKDFAKLLDKKFPNLWGDLCTNSKWKPSLDQALLKLLEKDHSKQEVEQFLKSISDKDLLEIRKNVMTL